MNTNTVMVEEEMLGPSLIQEMIGKALLQLGKGMQKFLDMKSQSRLYKDP